MCMNCACGSYNERHKPTDITLDDLKPRPRATTWTWSRLPTTSSSAPEWCCGRRGRRRSAGFHDRRQGDRGRLPRGRVRDAERPVEAEGARGPFLGGALGCPGQPRAHGDRDGQRQDHGGGDLDDRGRGRDGGLLRLGDRPGAEGRGDHQQRPGVDLMGGRGRPRFLVFHAVKKYLTRFVFGAGIATAAAIVGMVFGPKLGGILLAFPAILPASLTLIERTDGRHEAKVDATGALLGSFALIGFAAAAALALPRFSAGIALALACAA